MLTRAVGLWLCFALSALVAAALVSAQGPDPEPDACFGDKPAIAPGATTQWSEPQCLSPDEVAGEVPQVAIAEDGSALVVWRTTDQDSGRQRIQAAFRRRGEDFAPVNKPGGFLSGTDRDARPYIRVKMNKRGDAIVVWEVQGAQGAVSTRSVYKPYNGDFGDEQSIDSGQDPEVGIDGDGDPTVIYHPAPAPFNGITNQRSTYRSASRASGAGSDWTTEGLLLLHPLGSDAVPRQWSDDHASLSVDESGNQVVTLTSQEYAEGVHDPQYVVELSRSAGQTAWHEDRRHPGGQPNHTDESGARDTRTLPGRLATWARGNNLHASWFLGLSENINRNRDGPTPARGYDVAQDVDEDALVMWVNLGGSFDPQYGEMHAVHKPVSQPWGEPTEPVTGSGDYSRPRLATGANDSAVSVFQRIVGSDESVQGAIRKPGQATDFGNPVQLSGEADLEFDTNVDTGTGLKTRTGPRVAMNTNPDGPEGVAAWAINDGEGDRVQVSLLTPYDPDDPTPAIPPPPPPRPAPKPAVPSPIQLARAQARDQATVLKANVPEGTRELRWSFGTKGEQPIVGKVVDGKLQRGVRLRLPGTWRVKLEADEPDGTKTYTRSFTSFKPSRTLDVLQVQKGLEQAAPASVFAVGDPETLSGDPAPARASGGARAGSVRAVASAKPCSPTTVFSGQQKMSGCMKPLEGLGGVPAPESGALNEVATALKLDETNKAVMQKATEMTDGYVAQGRALLNDKFPVIPSGPASVLFNPQAKLMASANAKIPVGGGSYDLKKGFSVTVDPKAAKIPLGKLPKLPKLPSLAGLEIVGDWDVDLEKQEAKIKASVKLPPAIKKAGSQISNEVILRATPERVIVDEVRVGPIDVDIVGLKVNKFRIQYLREPNQWDGQGKACLIGTACLDMVPPNGGVTIRDGTLSRAGATLFFPPPGIPLYAGVNLERVGFGIGLDPTRIFGSARVGVAQFLKLDGRIFVAFPTTQHPFILDRKEVGDAYPGHLYGKRFNRFTFGATAEALVDVPVIGETKLGSAYVLYEYPGYVAFGGGYSADVLGLLTVRGGVAAEADAERGAFDIHGEVKACLELDPLSLCSGATGHVSRGPGGTGGAGVCIDWGLTTIGGGVRWNDISDPYIWPIDGCKWSPFRIQVRQSGAASKAKGKRGSADRLVRASSSRKVRARESQVGVRAPGVYTVKVEKDKPNPALRLDGEGGAPAIRVSGPGGTLEAPADQGFVKSADNTLRILRFKNQYAQMTSIGFQGAKPGVYTVQTLPGSARVVSVQQATDPPDAKVTGKVTGKGRSRVLRYDVRKRAAQKVVFSELTATGAAKVIGSTTGGKGRMRFRSAPGHGRRTILAQFELSGISAERKRVTTFTPQSPVIARPRAVRVRRKGSRLLVSWKKVPGAARYEVAAAPSSRRMTFASTRGARVSMAMPRWVSGRVTVRAIDDLRQSATTAPKRFAATGSQPSPIRALQRCKIGKRKIECLPPKRICAGRRATIVAEPGRVTRGTARKDVIVGTDGNDRIEGRGGNDLICGGGGADTIMGGRGNDRLRGGNGADDLLGGLGNDRIRGGSGNDRLLGEAGNDGLRGDAGNDSITGDSGRDKLSSGPDRDTLIGGRGNDRLNGGRGKDRLNGGVGRDRLRDGSRGRARNATP